MCQQRDRRLRAEGRAAAPREAAAADPAAGLTRDEERWRVARAVGRLPDRYGVPLHLGLQGLSPEQIAETLKLPVTTVKTRITRGRKLLLAKLQAEGLGTAAAVWLAEQRAEAVPAGLAAAAVRAAAAGKKPAVVLAATGWWLWAGVATAVLAGAVGTGLARGRPPRRPRRPTNPSPGAGDRGRTRPTAVAGRGDAEGDQALRPLMVFGRCDVTVTKTEVTHDAATIELHGKHQLGFQSVSALSLLATERRSGRGPGPVRVRDVQADQPGTADRDRNSRHRPVGSYGDARRREAFRAIPYRLPAILPPDGGSEFIRTVRPFLGVWCALQGDRTKPPSDPVRRRQA